MNQLLSWRTRVALTLVVCFFTFFASPSPAQYNVVNLVSNSSSFNPVNPDPNLVNGWGLVSFPTSPFWVSDQNSSNATLYTGAGAIMPLVVHIPCLVSGSVTVPCPFPGNGQLFEPIAGQLNFFGPTGIVANAFDTSGGFVIPGTGNPALFIFDTLDGLIVGWSPNVNVTQGVVVANRSSAGASYNGLAIAGPSNAPHLYAANTVPGGQVDVFDTNFNLVNSFAADADAPPLFAPYGVQTISNKLYVTYFNLAGSGGILDVCDLDSGATAPMCHRLYASLPSSPQLVLNAPWGLARTPHNFGVLSNKVLVGNVADGLIHAFEPDSGHLAGTLMLSDGTPFAVPGLWALTFGSGAAANGATNQLFFTAGPFPAGNPTLLFSEGLFGMITPAGNSHPGNAH